MLKILNGTVGTCYITVYNIKYMQIYQYILHVKQHAHCYIITVLKWSQYISVDVYDKWCIKWCYVGRACNWNVFVIKKGQVQDSQESWLGEWSLSHNQMACCIWLGSAFPEPVCQQPQTVIFTQPVTVTQPTKLLSSCALRLAPAAASAAES